MKQTVFISVISRTSSNLFRIDFDPMKNEANQIIGFLESKHLENKKYQLHKNYEYDPSSQFFIPHYSLVEVDKLSKDMCNEVEIENAKS